MASVSQPGPDRTRGDGFDALDRVDRLQAGMTDQAEAGDAKEGMKDVDDDAGPGGDAARGGILSIVPQRVGMTTTSPSTGAWWAHLGVQDEGLQAMTIDPMGPADHGQAADDPPAIADVLELLGPTVEATAGELARAEPNAPPLGQHQDDAAPGCRGRLSR